MYERIVEQVDRQYPDFTTEQKQRVVKQTFAKFIVRGRTIGRNMNTGKLIVS